MSAETNDLLQIARNTIRKEADGLNRLADGIGPDFLEAVRLILSADPYVIVTGVGKSGHVGAKVASSLASTGAPAFFLHPADASHGDLGMLTPGCVLLAISNSGESRELRDVLVYAQRIGAPVIGITREPRSTLGRMAQVALVLPDAPEACPNGLAPTTSTTNTLALGDALMVAAMVKRGFTPEDFGARHPGGKLGLQVQRVSDWLVSRGDPMPCVVETAKMADVIAIMTEGAKGCAAVLDSERRFAGMVTDGDLRRAISPDFFDKTARDVMTLNPFVATPDMRLADIIAVFTQRAISNAFVVEDGRPIGIVHMKDLMAAGYI